jgi:hypothetical protein
MIQTKESYDVDGESERFYDLSVLSTVSISGGIMEIVRAWLTVAIVMIVTVGFGWQVDPTTCTILSLVNDDKVGMQAVSDGDYGKIFVWRCNSGVYVQRVNSAGEVLWGDDGILVGKGLVQPNSWYFPQTPIYAVSDEAGGILLTWTNSQGVLAQRVDRTGSLMWDDDLIASSTEVVALPAMTSDGTGGFIVAWSEVRNDINNIYAQRVSGTGIKQWDPAGVILSSDVGITGGRPKAVSDGASGAIISWEDNLRDIYCQRIDSSGLVVWAENGIAVAVGGKRQWNHETCTDGAGGAFFMWEEDWLELRVQRVNLDGELLFEDEGIRFASPNDHSSGRLVADGTGGALMAWVERQFRSIHYQQVASDGALLWAEGGTSVSLGAYVRRPEVIPDGAGGGIICWVQTYTPGWTIFAQRIAALGEAQWAPGGIPVYTQAGTSAPMISSDERGGAIIAWNGVESTGALGAAQVSNEGVLGGESGVGSWALFEKK